MDCFYSTDVGTGLLGSYTGFMWIYDGYFHTKICEADHEYFRELRTHNGQECYSSTHVQCNVQWLN